MYEEVRQTIATFLQANWPATYPLFADNVGEQQPLDVPYGRYSIRPVDAMSMIIGADNAAGRRITAILWFQIFPLEGQGSTDANKFADIVAALFDETWMKDQTGDFVIKFRRSALQFVGNEPSGRPQWKCVVNFEVDDQRLASAILPP